MKHTTIGIDLAKSVFEVGVSDRPGQVARNHRLTRKQLMAFIAAQPPAVIVMEACGSAHYWGRRFQGQGHQVKLLPPGDVRPYVRRGKKTDRADVKGMLEAWRNQAIHPVPVKTESQQQLTALHRIRARWVATRTMRINAVRGLLREFGMVFPTGAARLAGRAEAQLEEADAPIPPVLREMLRELVQEIRELNARIRRVEKHLEAIAAQTPVVERLRTIPGVGLLTATALVGCVGEASRFPSGRHLASYLGLTPREYSSGARRVLGRISKQGDAYLRMLLIHGARAMLRWARHQSAPDRFRRWALQVHGRRGYNKAAVAAANKMARMVWAVWTSGKPFASPVPAVA